MKLRCSMFLIGFASLLMAGPFPAQDEIPWLENYGEAIREAKQTGKPILLEFRCEA